ncbi:hypothetical protein HZS_6865, partial [Henneguya salminicola]
MPGKIEKEISNNLLNSLHDSFYRSTEKDISSNCLYRSASNSESKISTSPKTNLFNIKEPRIKVTTTIIPTKQDSLCGSSDKDISSIYPNISATNSESKITTLLKTNLINIKKPRINVTTTIIPPKHDSFGRSTDRDLPSICPHRSASKSDSKITTSLKTNLLNIKEPRIKVTTITIPLKHDSKGRNIPLRAGNEWIYRPIEGEKRFSQYIINSHLPEMGNDVIIADGKATIPVPRKNTKCPLLNCNSAPTCLKYLRHHIARAHKFGYKNVLLCCSICMNYKSHNLMNIQTHCSSCSVNPDSKKTSFKSEDTPKTNRQIIVHTYTPTNNNTIKTTERTRTNLPDNTPPIIQTISNFVKPKPSLTIKNNYLPKKSHESKKLSKPAKTHSRSKKTSEAIESGKATLLKALNTLLETEEENDVWSNKFSDWINDLESFASRASINTRGPASNKYRDPTTAYAIRKRNNMNEKALSSPISFDNHTPICNTIKAQKLCANQLTPHDRLRELTKPSRNSKSSQLNRLFNANPRKAFEVICVNETPVKCNLNPNLVAIHYNNIWRKAEHSFSPLCGTNNFPHLMAPFSKEEILTKLFKLNKRSAAGPDKIFVNTWIWFCNGEGSNAILSLLNKFLKSKQLPACMKLGKTILIAKHKESSPDNIDDFRPITITSIIYRWFSGLLADRLNASAELFLHSSQRGFRKMDGCFLNVIEVGTLAYADDLILVARTREDLKLMEPIISNWCSVYGMELNHSKCGLIEARKKKGGFMNRNQFTFMDSIIPLIERDDAYKILGIKTGLNSIAFNQCLKETISECTRLARAINLSALAPHNKIKMIKQFIFPVLEHPSRLATISKKNIIEFN